MNVSTYTRMHTTLRLEREEEYVAHDDRNLPFFVRQVIYGGGDKATISGAAKVKDGSRGFVDRSALVPLSALFPSHREAITKSHRDEIIRLYVYVDSVR